jgi:hypothetical protein
MQEAFQDACGKKTIMLEVVDKMTWNLHHLRRRHVRVAGPWIFIHHCLGYWLLSRRSPLDNTFAE